MAEPLLRLSGITKRFGEQVANDAIDLVLHRGEIVGLLGENGAGKTTLMNILFGHYTADAGAIAVAPRQDGALRPLRPGTPRAALDAGIGMVHQHFALADNLSVRDNILLGTEPLFRPLRRRDAAQARLAELMRRVGLAVDLDAPVRTLSVGERQRVEILKVLYREARILILDEPTAVLTPQAAEDLFVVLRQLAADGLAIVFISHKLGEVLALCHRIAVLRAGRLVADRPIGEATRADLAVLMVGRPIRQPVRTARDPGPPVLEMADATVPGEGVARGLTGASLTVREGEIVGVAGVAGSGQAALTGLLAGMRTAPSGTIRLAGQDARAWSAADIVRRRVARVPEDRHHEGVIGDLSLWQNLILADLGRPETQRWGWLRRARIRQRTAKLMASYDIRAPGPDTRVRLLSGGNMQKLILARELERGPAFILADQPTRGLDVGAVTEIHGRLLAAREAGAGVLLVSEDLDELFALSDRIAVLHQGRLSPALPSGELDTERLGLMMGGHEDGVVHAA
ncbi:ABC transporter ATP-binding protein [Marinivivus vitaminiproducens]|uniref:ABC transporter ATP-binding protein n=1 Tax=Marinivivus vitaminiproducens TaxID=3035935 RepID=UPI00279861B0|nr:ABC transporter ATP-binding protein [Geminicoccaceae bacterium SCSIO 64248]